MADPTFKDQEARDSTSSPSTNSKAHSASGTDTKSINGRELCSMCPKLGPHTCSRCKCSRYCSPKCQKLDWPTHKLMCKKYVAFNQTQRSDGTFRAIYFPTDGSGPLFLWNRPLPTSQAGYFASGPSHLPPDTQPYLAPGSYGERIKSPTHGYDSLVHYKYFHDDPVLDRKYASTIAAWLPGIFAPAEGIRIPVNKSMEKLSPLFKGWMEGPEPFFSLGRGLDMMDFRHIVNLNHCAFRKVWV